jgi:hypothetical protein
METKSPELIRNENSLVAPAHIGLGFNQFSISPTVFCFHLYSCSILQHILLNQQHIHYLLHISKSTA